MFNENYTSCFEDVELNLQCILLGLKNYLCGRGAAYHYESQSRNDDPEKMKKLSSDYNQLLLPYISKNKNKLNKYIRKYE